MIQMKIAKASMDSVDLIGPTEYVLMLAEVV